MMISNGEIQRYVDTLARQFKPELVVLFGSYARGNPGPDSDVDMLVIMDHDKRKDVEQAADIDMRLTRRFPLDLIVRRPAIVRRRLARGDDFLRGILGGGRVLYERHS